MKTQNPSVLDHRFKDSQSPLMDFVDEDWDEMLLCPARMLRKLLSGTEEYHLVGLNCSSQWVRGRNGYPGTTFHFWIRLVINHAYRSANITDYTAVKVNAHEVWKTGTTFLFRKNCAVQQVLRAGMYPSRRPSLLPVLEMSPTCIWTSFPSALWWLPKRLCSSIALSTGVVTLVQSYFMAVCDRIHLDSHGPWHECNA